MTLVKEIQQIYDIGDTNYATSYDFNDNRVRFFVGDVYRSRQKLNELDKTRPSPEEYEGTFDMGLVNYQMYNIVRVLKYIPYQDYSETEAYDFNNYMAKMFTYSPELRASSKYLNAYLNDEPEPEMETIDDCVVYGKYGMTSPTQYLNLSSMVKMKTKSGEDAYELKFEKNLQRNFDTYKEIDVAEYEPVYVNEQAGRQLVDDMVKDVLHVKDKKEHANLVDKLTTGNTPSTDMVYNIYSLDWYNTQLMTRIDTMKPTFGDWSWSLDDDKYEKWADSRKDDAQLQKHIHTLVGMQGAVVSDKDGSHVDLSSLDMTQVTLDDEADRDMKFHIADIEDTYRYMDDFAQKLKDDRANYKRGNSVWRKIPHPHVKKLLNKFKQPDDDLDY